MKHTAFAFIRPDGSMVIDTTCKTEVEAARKGLNNAAIDQEHLEGYWRQCGYRVVHVEVEIPDVSADCKHG